MVEYGVKGVLPEKILRASSFDYLLQLFYEYYWRGNIKMILNYYISGIMEKINDSKKVKERSKHATDIH